MLRELIMLINGMPMDDALNTQPDIADAGIALVSAGTEPVENGVFDFGQVLDYSCNAGGSFEELRFTSTGNWFIFANCQTICEGPVGADNQEMA